MAQRKVLEPKRFDWLVGLLLEKMLVVQGILRKRGLKSSGLDRFIDSLKGLINE
ncbi:hypothetical protein [Thermococcus sp. M39]|uniref:hypothetical protein n=1 Tax=Thermococcus sp. M39 TaxID=1638262 RepID=UPI00143B4741|nr:hypothetical protein [Thermococcus sp. M39]